MRIIIPALAALAIATEAPAAGHALDLVTSEHAITVETVAEGLEHPWGLDWLPDGRMIVTERPGRIRIIAKDGAVGAPLAGVPEIVSEFRDGLLDVAVSPNFAADATVFFTYSAKDGDLRWLKVDAATLAEGALKDVRTIFEADVKSEKDQGFGSRIRFDAAGDLVISVGDHALGAQAQDPSNALGSIIRIKANGQPAGGAEGLHPAIIAYGFKNPQGLTIDGGGAIWAVDHGGVGGGELNLVSPGGNYGWPTRTFSGGETPRANPLPGAVDPVFTWGAAPTIAPSGLARYEGDLFPNWRGDLFIGSLLQETLIRVMLNEAGAVIGTETIIDTDLGRIREVRQGPDGLIYILNDDEEGGVYRIAPKS